MWSALVTSQALLPSHLHKMPKYVKAWDGKGFHFISNNCTPLKKRSRLHPSRKKLMTLSKPSKRESWVLFIYLQMFLIQSKVDDASLQFLNIFKGRGTCPTTVIWESHLKWEGKVVANAKRHEH